MAYPGEYDENKTEYNVTYTWEGTATVWADNEEEAVKIGWGMMENPSTSPLNVFDVSEESIESIEVENPIMFDIRSEEN